MAKKGARQIFALVCTVCKSQNYLTEKNKVNTPDKLEFKKYCPRCRKHQLHKETSKLK
ncbi:50S ribosomal protein L33 [Candidatus Amesbacteria bacterium RIFCSPLOWO2_02_FULL_48_11]|uniref:Large ribosomal subunit protein bL33 n=1 Tax=Candidatus Amesbacteria bacterium RIFCSPHIGHO2_12_FULL_48_14 TaxID=1797257 RepID=A0A1F4Z740_9BACT|nr:MAG: 50S ribosomal protein L33 [Candidatus Amesbacteria bacterium RIFCSPHIGHO2_01_FULL_48_75]OGD02182.1 MAG: 50S ribosomal protein L33 [Candidatus Amesbacteria bacterium RIFCSPHIGHO2_12_FULL_48_14]OGD06814.1 MAG: 50S ribosomal protein L33 [Candidatus Amesbacteria bacterium RIFCSPLOWO2_02_FULL_48_11]